MGGGGVQGSDYLNASDNADFPAVVMGLTNHNVRVMELNINNHLYGETSAYLRYFMNLMNTPSSENAPSTRQIQNKRQVGISVQKNYSVDSMISQQPLRYELPSNLTKGNT